MVVRMRLRKTGKEIKVEGKEESKRGIKCWKDDIKKVYTNSDETIGKGQRERERERRRAERTVRLEATRTQG